MSASGSRITKLVSAPGNDPPIAPDGQQASQSWLAFHQSTENLLNSLGRGSTDGAPAEAGMVGEVASASGTVPTLSSDGIFNIASLVLQPGDWDVSGNVLFVPAATTHPTQAGAGISLVSATFGATIMNIGATFTVGANIALDAGGIAQVNVAVPTPVYLVARASFTTAGMGATGTIRARRMQ
jgi:hypothetical protein